MAPILNTAVGVPQLHPSQPSLQTLLETLRTVDAETVQSVLEEEAAVSSVQSAYCWEEQVLTKCGLRILDASCFSLTVITNSFSLQVDLYQWIEPLNNLDAILRSYMAQYPQLLLLPPVPRVRKTTTTTSSGETKVPVAQSLEQVSTVPPAVVQSMIAILSFWEALLRNSTSKSLFNSVEECCDLLASASDLLADKALSVLQALAIPPALHKQQAPQSHLHAISLQQVHPICLERVTVLAKGYSSRAVGMGLYQVVLSATQQQQQQQIMSPAVQFSYYDFEKQSLVEIHLEEQEILSSSNNNNDNMTREDDDEASQNKRRRVTAKSTTTKSTTTDTSNEEEAAATTKSTAELFFLACSKATTSTHPERLFPLLADIRWARSKPLDAIHRRLAALVCILHAHPSQEIMTGYFAAQPELCAELVDLLRPTVSAAAVSSAAAAQNAPTYNSALQIDGIAGLADTQVVPYHTRMLALEALCGLISRRDGMSGALSGSARLSNVLLELGVGKGQYLGLLPTLIRYSLATLGNGSNVERDSSESNGGLETNASLELGLAFVEAMMPPQSGRVLQVKQALEMIDCVLTLTSAVVASPSGTASLTDCGLIPALLATISADMDKTYRWIMRDETKVTSEDEVHIKSLLRFITAQAIQILEGAIVTHSNASTAFHDLNGVEVLTSLLLNEMSNIPGLEVAKSDDQGDAMEIDQLVEGEPMEGVEASGEEAPWICPSQRVLLFGVVTSLTVVFHQESSTATVAATVAGAQLRKKEMAAALIKIMDHVNVFGGHLASLVATLLSDVMNNDPQIVYYIHESGIAKSFLTMILGKHDGELIEPIIPPVAELIMAIPNVVAALALTADGAKAVKEARPFPSLLRLFYHPDFAMPKSRCLLSEMTSIFGTGLDEIMRHVAILRSEILIAMAEAIKNVVKMATDLAKRERKIFGAPGLSDKEQEAMDIERTRLIQYVLNFGQLLEQVLHNEEQCEPFIDAGGLDGLLDLYLTSMPSGVQFLTHVSTLSSISVSTLHHATIEDTIVLALKSIQFRYSSQKLIHKVTAVTKQHLDQLEASRHALFGDSDLSNCLDKLPPVPLYKIDLESSDIEYVELFSHYLKDVAVVQWITRVLSSTIKAVCQRSQETGASGWSASERGWKQELSGPVFTDIAGRLSEFYQSALVEVCRARTEEGFDAVEKERLSKRCENLVYRLRIVCPEGAIVRDGIEIDSCANVGSMEMGEIALAFDRCINSSGIMRWQTERGWISEMTRGHGREPIAEVISVVETSEMTQAAKETEARKFEAGIPGLRFVGIGVLARGQALYSELFREMSRLSVQGVPSLVGRTISFDTGTAGEHISSVIRMLSDDIIRCLNSSGATKHNLGQSGLVMYFGNVLNHVDSCIFDDRRERRLVNLPLLVHLLDSDSVAKDFMLLHSSSGDEYTPSESTEKTGVLGACSFVFAHGMEDLLARSRAHSQAEQSMTCHRRVSRCVAASFPPLIAFLRRLACMPISTSPVASAMSRVKWDDVPKFFGKEGLQVCFHSTSNDGFFEPERFLRVVQLGISRLLNKVWVDPNFCHVPAHLMYPIVSLTGDLVAAFDDSLKKKGSTTSGQSRTLLSHHVRRRQQIEQADDDNDEEDAEFEPDDNVVAMLVDMGFDRDRVIDALETTGSNDVEVAMEHVLTHPPPSPETVERRRAEREARQRQRQMQESGDEVDQGAVADAVVGERLEAGNIDVLSNDPNISSNNSEAMEVDTQVEKGNDDAVTETEFTALSIKTKEELTSWTKIAPTVACQLLTRMDEAVSPSVEKAFNGDGQVEGVTVILSSFLLDLSTRFPEECQHILSSIFEQLETELRDFDSGRENDMSLAALCHAAVLITRAHSKSRVLVLHYNLVTSLVNSLQIVASSIRNGGTWPVWLASVLLLLESMSQPVVGFSDHSFWKGMLDESLIVKGGELRKMQEEHKTLTDELEATVKTLFSSTSGNEDRKDGTSKSNDKSLLETPEGRNMECLESSVNADDGQEKARSDTQSDKESATPLSSLLGYFPLLPTALMDSCLESCVAFLGVGVKGDIISVQPPPGVAHASLLFLLRLLKTPAMSSKCRLMGAVEAILSLPGESKFVDNAQLVALVFRRLLEDELTLQAAMEADMRSAVSRLQAAASPRSTTISLHTFIETVTPLLSRDPTSFVKAMVLAAKFQWEGGKGLCVSLVSNEERSKIQERVSRLLVSQEALVASNPSRVQQPKVRGRSPHHKKDKDRRSLSACNKGNKEKVARPSNSSSSSVVESPATHVISLLVNSVVSSFPMEGDDVAQKNQFLWIGSLLEIMSHLIVSVPSCASAVHNCRPFRNKDKVRLARTSNLRHALSGCMSPPKTLVNFLLHVVLTQDRWSIRSDSEIWERPKGRQEVPAAIKEKKEKAFFKTKSSQAAARVLLSLAARPGEGRKRIVADLTFALSGGWLGHGLTGSGDAVIDDAKLSTHELLALQAWGDLAAGLVAPRSSIRSLDGVTSLSTENARVMLESGFVHALSYALHRVNLFHPMASSTAAALIYPLECLTRYHVSENIQKCVDKETKTATVTEGDVVPNQSEHATTVSQEVHYTTEIGEPEPHDEAMNQSDGQEPDELTSDEETSNGEDEDGSSDSEMDEVDDSVDDDDEDDDEDEEQSSDSDVEDEEVEDEGQWNMDYENDFMDEDDIQQDADLAAEDGLEQALEEGWTRVDSSNLVDEEHPSVPDQGDGHDYVDAAEALIGSLLREGGVTNETLAQLEETLGMQISANGRRNLTLLTSTNSQGQRMIRALGESDRVEQGMPRIQQRNQPNFDFSSFGRVSRGNEVSSMEYVFGGPTLTSGSRNYDLMSSDDVFVSETGPQVSISDLQLFPSGAASSTSSRVLQPLHALLRGLDLPPMSSLVSDLLPHGIRATQPGQLMRRPGTWTSSPSSSGFGASTNGGTLRRVRSHAAIQNGATLADFTGTFERIISETVTPAITEQTETDTPMTDGVVELPVVDRPDGSASAATSTVEQPEQEDNPCDGDVVASSLAEGLRLSPADGDDTQIQLRDDEGDTTSSMALGTHLHDHEDADVDNDVAQAMNNDERPSDQTEVVATEVRETSPSAQEQEETADGTDESNANGLVCPPDIDVEVFNSLPLEVQQECVNQYNSTRELADQLNGSSLDPEILAALPEDVRREVIEQERQERLMQERAQAPADPSHAEEMDNASFIASLTPELREEILLSADDAFLNSLPPNIIAEAQLLRERATVQQRRLYEGNAMADEQGGAAARVSSSNRDVTDTHNAEQNTSRRKKHLGKLKIELDRDTLVYLPQSLSSPFGKVDIIQLIRLTYLSSPVQPARLLQKLFHNLSSSPTLRSTFTAAFIRLLHDDCEGCRRAIEGFKQQCYDGKEDDWRSVIDKAFPVKDFPPLGLLGTAPDVPDSQHLSKDSYAALLNRKFGHSALSIVANLPRANSDVTVPPVVSARLLETLVVLSKSSPRYCIHMLTAYGKDGAAGTSFEQLLDLLDKPKFTRSSANLDHLLSLIEVIVSPLSELPKLGQEDAELSESEVNAAAAAGKVWVDIPRIAVSQSRLQMLCAILRLESCRDTSFNKVNFIVRRLCRVDMNRGYVLEELASVAHALGSDAMRDLKALRIRMENAASQHKKSLSCQDDTKTATEGDASDPGLSQGASIGSSVTLSTSSSELKLLRVLQTLQSLCTENWEEAGGRKTDNTILVTDELVYLLRKLDFGYLWDELSSCLAIVQVLEGVKAFEDEEKKNSEETEISDDASGGEGNLSEQRRKKLRNSAAGLLTRFLPAIEAFFVANASATRGKEPEKEEVASSGITQEIHLENLVDGQRLLEFAATNKVLLNALVRNNSTLIDKGLRALVQVPRCRSFLDFDVKRQWFKTQVRRLRQQASRRHGSLRLHIRRKFVFEDAYHQLRLRNAEEMRGRLHITFRNEEGVDAGGLSREFFAILAKEIFNPNYALFTSTEDGCTFQPNPNSSINPDHLSYFRFVGRIVGKALADGFLLDAHFTRSLYKHMLGMTPTYHDMEAIDPDYYRNLKTILEFSLADIGLDLTFSTEDHSFGRNQTIDLKPNGRNIHVTDENKDEYVRLVCQHRMTAAIQSQIKAYLDGFYELVSPELIALFTPRELELLISGLPDIDVMDLKANTEYAGWKASDNEIVWFWNILFSLSRNEKAAFLQFVTGSSKVPLSGFGELQGMRGVQKFSIHKVAGKKGALMSAHTCFNQLDLPNYDSEEEMKNKLLFAINEGGGAFLFA